MVKGGGKSPGVDEVCSCPALGQEHPVIKSRGRGKLVEKLKDLLYLRKRRISLHTIRSWLTVSICFFKTVSDEIEQCKSAFLFLPTVKVLY
jgi:hypothetical protein